MNKDQSPYENCPVCSAKAKGAKQILADEAKREETGQGRMIIISEKTLAKILSALESEEAKMLEMEYTLSILKMQRNNLIQESARHNVKDSNLVIGYYDMELRNLLSGKMKDRSKKDESR